MFFFFNDTATTEIYTYCHTLSLHDALPICTWLRAAVRSGPVSTNVPSRSKTTRSNGNAFMGASCAGDPMALARFLWHRRLERASSTGKLMPSTPIAAVVLAAGMVTRMTSDLPQVLHPLAARPILFHLLYPVAAIGIPSSKAT